MIRTFIARRLGKFLVTALAWVLAAGFGGYLLMGNAFLLSVRSAWSASAARLQAAADRSRLSTLESGIGESTDALRRLEETGGALDEQIEQLEDRRSRAAERLGESRRRLREALGGAAATSAAGRDDLAADLLDACRQGHAELKALDAALGEARHAAESLQSQVRLARRSVDRESGRVQIQKLSRAAQDALARAREVVDGIPREED